MGILGDYTIAQLRKAVAEGKFDQIRTALKTKIDNLTNKQLIILILKVADIDIENWEEVKRVVSTGDARGQLLEIDEVRNILNNKLRSKRREWSYYPSGPVDIITITELDANDEAISTKRIKHYLDGRQPKEI